MLGLKRIGKVISPFVLIAMLLPATAGLAKAQTKQQAKQQTVTAEVIEKKEKKLEGPNALKRFLSRLEVELGESEVRVPIRKIKGENYQTVSENEFEVDYPFPNTRLDLQGYSFSVDNYAGEATILDENRLTIDPSKPDGFYLDRSSLLGRVGHALRVDSPGPRPQEIEVLARRTAERFLQDTAGEFTHPHLEGFAERRPFWVTAAAIYKGFESARRKKFEVRTEHSTLSISEDAINFRYLTRF